MNALEVFESLKSAQITPYYEFPDVETFGYVHLRGHLLDDNLNRVDANVEWTDKGCMYGVLDVCFWNLEYGDHEHLYYDIASTDDGFRLDVSQDIAFDWKDVCNEEGE